MTGIESEQHRAKIRERVVRVIGNYYKTPPPKILKMVILSIGTEQK